jgi:hypothetical protein
MKIQCDFSTIKASKRHLLSNPITAAFHAIQASVSENGYEIVQEDPDVVFVFGSITRRKMDTERAISIQQHRDNNTPIFSLDSSLFSTYIRNRMNSPETYMFRVGYGDCVGTGNFLNKNSNSQRYLWMKEAFQFEEKEPVVDNDRPILFLLQSEKGWQYDDHLPFYSWARKVVKQLRDSTDKKIILRSHPNLDRNPTAMIAEGFNNIEIEHADKDRRKVIESIRQAGVVVTHSSSAACESITEGIPTIALDSRCVVYDACMHDLSLLNNLELVNWDKREQNLYNWSYTSWTVDEMAKPEWLNYYLKKAELIK